MNGFTSIVVQMYERGYPPIEAIDTVLCEDGTTSAMVHLKDGNGVSANFGHYEDVDDLPHLIKLAIIAAQVYRDQTFN